MLNSIIFLESNVALLQVGCESLAPASSFPFAKGKRGLCPSDNHWGPGTWFHQTYVPRKQRAKTTKVINISEFLNQVCKLAFQICILFVPQQCVLKNYGQHLITEIHIKIRPSNPKSSCQYGGQYSTINEHWYLGPSYHNTHSQAPLTHLL